MKILIPTLGSRGDVQPYINLGVELQAAGFEVTIATHRFWEETITAFDINFIPLGPEVNVDDEAANVKSGFNIFGILKILNTIHETASAQLMEVLNQFDLLIVSHMLCGAMEAKKLNKPYVSVTLVPSTIPEIKGGRKLKNSLQTFAYSFYFNAGPWGKIKKRHGLKNVTQFSDLHSPELNLLPVSQYICPRSVNWGENHVVTGIWQLPSSDQDLPDWLSDFLDKHPSPIIVALGAMSFDSDRDVGMLQTIIDAITKSGHAGIIQGFTHSILKIDVPENILAIGPFPHDLLFQQGKLIIHHGGFGTMTTALYAGKPSVVIPYTLDQPFWAKRLFELKCCPRPIPAKKVTEGSLVSSINTCINDLEIIGNTTRMMERLRGENGVQKARELIELFIKEKLH